MAHLEVIVGDAGSHKLEIRKYGIFMRHLAFSQQPKAIGTKFEINILGKIVDEPRRHISEIAGYPRSHTRYEWLEAAHKLFPCLGRHPFQTFRDECAVAELRIRSCSRRCVGRGGWRNKKDRELNANFFLSWRRTLAPISIKKISPLSSR